MLHTFHVAGTHCNACKMLIEDVLSEDTTLRDATVDLEKKTLSLESDEEKPSLIKRLNTELTPFGYTLS